MPIYDTSFNLTESYELLGSDKIKLNPFIKQIKKKPTSENIRYTTINPAEIRFSQVQQNNPQTLFVTPPTNSWTAFSNNPWIPPNISIGVVNETNNETNNETKNETDNEINNSGINIYNFDDVYNQFNHELNHQLLNIPRDTITINSNVPNIEVQPINTLSFSPRIDLLDSQVDIIGDNTSN